MTPTTRAPRDPRPSAPTRHRVAASSAVAATLHGPPRAAQITGVGRHAAYLRVADGGVVAIEAAGGVGLPNAVALDRSGGLPDVLRPGVDGVVGDSGIVIDGHFLVVARWWDPQPRVGRVARATLHARRRALPTPTATTTMHFALAEPVAALRHAATRGPIDGLPDIVGALVGRGPGSTPSGDDVLAGLLATLRVLGPALGGPTAVHAARVADAVWSAVAPLGHRTTALSATLLAHADRGAVVRDARSVLRALAGHGPVATRATRLAGVGHTSGRDLLQGVTIGAAALTADRQELP